MMMVLDETDRRILWSLDIDARRPLVEIANRLGISKQVLGKRIQRLTERGIIQRYIAIIDIHRLGLLTYRLYFRLKVDAPAKTNKFIQYLCDHKYSLFVGTMSGAWDGEVVFTCRNFIHFGEILQEINGMFGDAIHRSSISMTPVVHLFRRDYLMESKRKSAPVETYGYEPLLIKWDELDYAILESLSNDCRLPYDEIGKKLGVTHHTVKSRMMRLEKEGIIKGYRTLINSSLLGRIYVKALMELAPSSNKKLELFKKNCAKHLSLLYLTQVLGPWQIEIEAEVERTSELDLIVRDLRLEHPNLVLDFHTVSILEEKKLNYLPPGSTTKELLLR